MIGNCLGNFSRFRGRKTVAKKLKKKKSLLKAELEITESESRKRKIKQDIEVIDLQRSKGVAVYKELKRAKAEARAAEGGGIPE